MICWPSREASGRSPGTASFPGMDEASLLDQLADLARDSGIDVRVLARTPGPDLAPASAVCRVRGQVWVVLSEADRPADRIRVLGQALREHAGAALADRYLPPAIRALLEEG